MAVAPREMAMPFAIDPLGRVAFTTDPFEQINQHISMLLGTHLNERFMTPSYGIDTMDYIFANMDEGIVQRLQVEIETALTNWEPLVLLRGVTVTPERSENSLTVSVDYSIQGTAIAGDPAVHTATVQIGGTVVASRG